MLPILFQNDEVILYSYPLLMGLGWGVAYQIFFSLIPESVSTLRAQIIFWGLFIFGWIGAKLLFVVTYPSAESMGLMLSSSFWTGGGFVFYGGLMGGVIFLAILKLLDRELKLKNLWPMLPALSIGHGIGRLGCFLAGCCFGHPTTLPWGIHLHGAFRHPTQLIEAVGLLALGYFLIKSKRSKIILLSDYLISYGVLRLIVESLRGDIVRGSWGLLTPSQWISCLLVVIGLNLYRKNRALAPVQVL